MEILASFVGAPVNALTLLIAAGVLFFQLVDRGLLKIGKSGAERVPGWAQRLDSYFNHETTDTFKRIEQNLKEMNDKMDRHNDMEKENHNKLQEILTYGVRCRDK